MRFMRPTLSVIVLLMAVAIGVRAMIPAGFMPDLTALARGTITMVVCTQNGPVTMQIAADKTPQPGKHTAPASADHNVLCQFAAVGPGLMPDNTPFDVLYIFIIAAAIQFLVLSHHHAGRRYQRLAQPRGPPVTSL